MVDRLISAVMALCLAFLVWLYAHGRDQETVDNVPIPVQLNLAPGQESRYDLEVNGPAQVLVSFTGPPSRIRELRNELQRGELHVEMMVAVPEDRENESCVLDTVHVEAADVHPPPGVTPVVVEGRNRIPVTLHRLVERPLPVRLDAGPDEEVGAVVFEPATVIVRGPQEILERTRAIPTRPLTLPPRGEEEGAKVVVRRVALVRELEGRPVRATPATVTARVSLPPRQRVVEIADVPVRFLCPPDFPLRPHFSDGRSGKVSLRIRGPAGESVPPVTAFIDLTGEPFKAGLYAGHVLRVQLPREFQLAQEPPRSGAFQLLPTEAAVNSLDVVPDP